MTHAMIAQVVRVQGQTISRTLVRLESYSYVHRQRGHSDRRSRLVSIATAGTLVMGEARELERLILIGAAMDGDKLRGELQTIVLALSSGTKSQTG
jgi:DNA-binding MarR family transcriptional regulator